MVFEEFEGLAVPDDRVVDVVKPADDGRLLLFATCKPPPPGLGPLGLSPPG